MWYSDFLMEWIDQEIKIQNKKIIKKQIYIIKKIHIYFRVFLKPID